MTWGRDTDTDNAAQQLREFVDAGGTLVDTSSAYADGDAERIVGGLLAHNKLRDEVVLCTTGGRDASRRSLLADLDGSLERLGTDHVDLFLVACPDPATPLEETASALRLAVTSGRTRYVGLSNHPGWASARLASLLDDIGLTALEVEYSLLERGVEREVRPAAAALGMGLLAWSPLGRGVLTGKYRRTVPADSRAASPHLAGFVEPYLTERCSAIVEAVCTAAEGMGRAPGDIALAWLLTRTTVAAAIVGARTPHQLRQSIEAAGLGLPAEVHAALDDVTALPATYPEAWPTH
jgi:aryl-alcohol dehydrogenase-like predicted oxidoreductase